MSTWRDRARARMSGAARRSRWTPGEAMDPHTALLFRLLKGGLERFVPTAPQDIPPPQGIAGEGLTVERLAFLGPQGIGFPTTDPNATVRPGWLSTLMQTNNRGFPIVDDPTPWASHEEAAAEIAATYGDALPLPPPLFEDPASDAATADMALHGLGAHRIERHTGPEGASWVLPQSRWTPLDVRPGFSRYGGDIVLNTDGTLRAIRLHGSELRPGDRGWAHAKFAARSTLLSVVTLEDHLGEAHCGVSNAVGLCTWKHLDASHPLRAFLAPFLFRTAAINHGSAQSLLPPGALIHRAGALTWEALEQIYRTQFTGYRLKSLPDQLKRRGVHPVDLPESERAIYPWASDALLFWEALSGFVEDAFSRSQALQEVTRGPWAAPTRAWWGALAALLPGALPSLSESALRDLLARVLFQVTAMHAQVAGVGPYVGDPRSVGARIRPRSTSADRENTMQVCAIAMITALEVPMLAGDVSHLMPDSGAKRAHAAFQVRLVELEQRITAQNAHRPRPIETFLPSRVPCSVSR